MQRYHHHNSILRKLADHWPYRDKCSDGVSHFSCEIFGRSLGSHNLPASCYDPSQNPLQDYPPQLCKISPSGLLFPKSPQSPITSLATNDPYKYPHLLKITHSISSCAKDDPSQSPLMASTINWFVQQICTLSLANLQICWTENQGVNLSHM